MSSWIGSVILILSAVRRRIAMRCSTPVGALAHESRRLRRATIRRQRRPSRSGMPLEYTPGSLIEWVTHDMPVITRHRRSSYARRCRTAPPIMHRAPMRVLPDMPVQAA